MKSKSSGNNPSLDGSKLGRELGGLFSIFFGLLLILSLATFDTRDPWLNHVVSSSAKIYNKAGLFGSYVGGFLFDSFGYAAWVVPAFFCLVGARRILSSPPWPWWRWVGVALIAVVVAFVGASTDAVILDISRPSFSGVSTHAGGLLGHLLYGGLVATLSPTGAWLLWTLCLLLSVQMLVGFSWLVVVAGIASALWRTAVHMAEDVLETKRQKKTQRSSHEGWPELAVETKPHTIETKPLQISYPPSVTTESTTFLSSPASETMHSSDSIVLLSPEEANLPPWVKDFEEGRLGLENNDEASLPQVLDNTLPVASVKTTDQFDSTFSSSQNEPDIRDTAPRKEVIMDFDENAPQKRTIGEATGIVLARVSPKIILPPLSLVESLPVSSSATKLSRQQLAEKGKVLITCLTDFGIQGELVGITPGPVVTMFEVRPAPGVRVSRIANLSDDLALALKAVAVRIQAPVPGTDTVGVEIPNDVRETVGLRELLASETFQKSSSLLTLAIGKDIAGNPAVADLATMPHLLVAGATGAGKSVGINSILLSILYKAKPDEVQLLLIDPKRVEMAVYADLPHLVHPVVTDMQLAKNALDWAVKEMEERYSSIARAGVRNIGDYNAKLKELGNKRPDGMQGLEAMPYLVIIIDELADLMLVAAKEVEISIVRLAQLARAAGIHLILATQRPSVDVVTGIIKANFPCRISFQVTSKHDSRTILDTVGAEHLLGKGDMLFKPSGGRFQRMHGAFVQDKTVLAVVDFWKAQQKPFYSIDFAEWGVDALKDTTLPNGSDDITSDPIYIEATEFVRQQGKASISLIQRRFRIGFNKAARLVEQMEQDGIIGPADGSRPRQVLR